MRRVVVTGLGMLTSLGHDVETTWQNILAGKSGIRTIDLFDTTGFNSTISSSVQNFDPTLYMEAKEVRRTGKYAQFGVAACRQAFDDSGFEVTDDNAHRVGLMVGSGIGGVPEIEQNYALYMRAGARKISPFFIPGTIINMIPGLFSIHAGIKGPNLSMVSACSTGTHNISMGSFLIQRGDCDAVIAGGAEMSTSPLGVGGFASTRALSTRNDDPEKASRPWDRDRDGFVLGDGAGAIMLEEYESAKKRGAKIYAELVGNGMSGDAYHMTSPSEDGDGAFRCMQSALTSAQINPGDVDYLNAHATSTSMGDRIETHAIKRVFGTDAYNMKISSTKSMIGHLLGAAGSVEAIFCLLALRDNVVPPTINLDNPDEGLDLDFVPHQAQEINLDVVASNSFGFGGTNGTIVFKRV